MRTKNRFRMISAMLAVLVALFAVTPMQAFAYTGETDAVTEAAGEQKEAISETDSAKKDARETENSLPYEIKENEDGTITVTMGEREWSFDPEDSDTAARIGTVVNVHTYLHLRDGAGMDANIIGHLLNGDTMEILEQDGEWYKVVVPEQAGYVHSNYVKVAEQAATGEDGKVDENMLSMLLYLMLSGAGSGNASADSTGLTPDGNMTLIDDIGSSSAAGQQFITFETKSGNTFYMVIDRNDKGDENVHFLNLVDEADLMALMEDGEVTVKCTCAEKCEAGHVDTNCSVCRNNMSECTGQEKVTEPEPTTEPTEPEEPDDEGSSGMGGLLFFLLIAAGAGGGALWYFKFRKPKADTKGSDDLDDYDFGDEDDDDVDYVPDDDDVDTSEESED